NTKIVEILKLTPDIHGQSVARPDDILVRDNGSRQSPAPRQLVYRRLGRLGSFLATPSLPGFLSLSHGGPAARRCIGPSASSGASSLRPDRHPGPKGQLHDQENRHAPINLRKIPQVVTTFAPIY